MPKVPILSHSLSLLSDVYMPGTFPFFLLCTLYSALRLAVNDSVPTWLHVVQYEFNCTSPSNMAWIVRV